MQDLPVSSILQNQNPPTVWEESTTKWRDLEWMRTIEDKELVENCLNLFGQPRKKGT